MGNTIVPIAVKPAMFAWPTRMNDEPVRVVFHLNRDSPLLRVLGSAVQFQAMNAGLEANAGEQLGRAAEDVCRETISQLAGEDGGLDVTLETFADRIEVAIHCHGQRMPAAGLDTFASFDGSAGDSGGLNGLELLSRVDRVLYNADEGAARTTLVKFLPSHR